MPKKRNSQGSAGSNKSNATAKKSTFTSVPDKPFFPKMEEDILARWKDIKPYERCLEDAKGKKPFVFYDGPPFATGLPHYGHLLASTIKDVICRYAHQTGYYVERRWGWDTHGLPVENEIDKMLNIQGKGDVLKMGIDVYNEKCRSIVLKYADEWEKTIHRMARWVSFEKKYMTMDPNFMESCWWIFKQLFDKGHVYRAFRVMPYSTKCATTLSNFELSQNYKEVSDPSITIKFKCKDENAWFVCWTTTPWSGPGIMALTVNAEFIYYKVLVKKNNETWIFGKDRFAWVMSKVGVKAQAKDGEFPKDTKDYTILEQCVGKDLVGREFEPQYPCMAEQVDPKTAFRIYADGYVSNDAGTCIVTNAPCHGEEDFRIALANDVFKRDGTHLINCIDDDGHFTSECVPFAGRHVKECEKDICKYLTKEGFMIKNEVEVHSYPHCWRTDTPLIRKAVPSWFIEVEKHRERLVKSNNMTNWVPNHVKEKRFHNWLSEARDWCISRSRFWGCPIPLWCSEDFEEIVCIGSIEELQQYAPDRKITDIHTHFIDDIQIPSKQGKGMLKRIPDVFDCWFESGSMPFAQQHYPFENKEYFEANFPAKFISEGVDQTRGWFYTLIVLSTLLRDQAPWQNLIVSGLVLAQDGKKMSKRLKNYPDPVNVINAHGADAVRLYLLNSPVVRAETLKFREDGVKSIIRDVFLPWYNAYRFLVQESHRYEQNQKKAFSPDMKLLEKSTNDMDKWIMASAQELLAFVKEEIDNYRLYTIAPKLINFLLTLTNWYVRLNRDRMRGNSGAQEALCSLSALYSVLLEINILLAPLTPYITEHMYLNLREALKDNDPRKKDSVHFVMISEVNEKLRDPAIVRAVDTMRQVVEMGRVIRERRKVGVKMPVRAMTITASTDVQMSDLERLRAYVEEELNVIKLDIQVGGDSVKFEAIPNFKLIGPMVGKQVPQVKKAFGELTQEQIKTFKDSGKLELLGFTFSEEHVVLQRVMTELKDKNLEGESEGDIAILMDFTEEEGLTEIYLSRELVNRVQRLRKDAGLQQSDPVDMYGFNFSNKLGNIASKKTEYLNKLLRRELLLSTPDDAEVIIAQEEFTFEKEKVKIVIVKKSPKFLPALDKVSNDKEVIETLKAFLQLKDPKELIEQSQFTTDVKTGNVREQGNVTSHVLKKGVHYTF